MTMFASGGAIVKAGRAVPAVDTKRSAAEAALRPVGGVGEIQVVGALADEVVQALRLESDARSVWLHPNVVQHIQERRTQEDATFVLEHMASTILRPHHAGPDPRIHRCYALVKQVDDRYVFIAIKCVTADYVRRHADEIWISTAYVLGDEILTRKRWANMLAAVLWDGRA